MPELGALVLGRCVVVGVGLCSSRRTLLECNRQAVAGQMTMTTLVGSHCNYVARCYTLGVRCRHPEHSSANGWMNMAYLAENDAAWHTAVSQGTMTTILSYKLREEDPEGMLVVMQADNLKHGANLVDHSLQLIRRMLNVCLAEEAASRSVNKELVCMRVASTLGIAKDQPGLDFLFNFAVRWGKSPAFTELEDFRSAILQDGKRDVEAALVGKVAALPLDLPCVAAGLLKCALTCPAEALVGHVCKFVSPGEVESLRAGKANHAKAQECESMLRQFRSQHAAHLEALPPAARTELLTRVDCQAVRLMLGKKCKFKNYVHLLSELAPTQMGSGVAPGPETPQLVPGLSMVSFVGGEASLVDRLSETGVREGHWVAMTHALPGVEKGCLCFVQSVSEDTVILMRNGALKAGAAGGGIHTACVQYLSNTICCGHLGVRGFGAGAPWFRRFFFLFRAW